MKNIALIDFTQESIQALTYAIEFTKVTGGKLELVNVSDSKNFVNSYNELLDIRDRYATTDFTFEVKELIGEFEEELSDYIENEKIGFVFSGTHNMTFFERFLSSRALKLLNRIQANFVFVPSSAKTDQKMNKIVIPVFSDKHSLQNIEALRYLNLFMKLELVLVTPKVNDPELKTTLITGAKLLEKAGIPFTVESIGQNEDELRDLLVDLAVLKKANLISIVNLTEQHMFNFGVKGFVEKLIRNEAGLPVLVIQNHSTEYYSGFHTSGGY